MGVNGMKNIIVSNPVRRCLEAGHTGWKKNGFFLLFCLILFGGIVYGAVSGRTADESLLQRLDFILQTNYELRCQEGVFAALMASFASSSVFLTVIFLLGLSLWGGFLAVLVPFFKGYGYGLSVGFLYGAYGLQGLCYNLLVILPGMFFSSAVIAAASLKAYKNSLHMVLGLFRSPMTADWRSLVCRYCRSMIQMLLLCAASAVVDMLCALCFSWLFHFS